MKKTITVVLVALCLNVVVCSDSWAQATAQISGSVADQSGAGSTGGMAPGLISMIEVELDDAAVADPS